MPRLGGRGRFGRLDGQQLKDFRDAILDAFGSLQSFSDLLQYYLSRNLQTLSLKTNLLAIIQDVIDEAETKSWTAELLQAARVAEQTNAALIEFAEQFRLSSIGMPARELERMIRETNASFNVLPWLQRLGNVETCLCKIEVPVGGDSETGTGFLLGPNIVMTNYHVMEKIIQGQVLPGRVVFRFDFKMLADGETLNPGEVYHLVENDWLLDKSEYSTLDLTANTGTEIPREDQLDYALLKVQGQPGTDPIDGPLQTAAQPKTRGWIEFPEIEPALQEETPLFILQYPKGQPLKLALNTQSTISVVPPRNLIRPQPATRVRYKTNTDEGSSGSPCFDLNWQLIALHHSGDPDYSQFHKPEYNEGIPIWAIRRLLEARGKLSLLGRLA